MAELIRKPSANVSRRNVEAALLRLLRYPATTSVHTVMRMVDEYAASQHTDKVYKHADKIVAEALVQAAYAKELDKKIFVEVDGVEAITENYVKNFYAESTWKKFLSDLFSEADSVSIMVSGANSTCPTCLNSPISRKCQECPGCPHGPQCPICPVTGVTDTSGPTTPVPDTGGTDTAVTDTRDSVTGDTDKGGLATVSGDKGTLATPVPDTADTATVVRVLMDDAQLNRAPEDDAPEDRASLVAQVDQAPKVDMATYENGKSAKPEGGAPDALADGETIKECSRCGRALPLSAYVLARGRRGGRSSACRECEQQRHRDYRAAKREARQNGGSEGQKRPPERL